MGSSWKTIGVDRCHRMHDVLEEAGRKLVRLGGDAGGGALQGTDAAYADAHIVQGSRSQGRADGCLSFILGTRECCEA